MITGLSLGQGRIHGALSIFRREVECDACNDLASTGIVDFSQGEEQPLSKDIAEYTI